MWYSKLHIKYMNTIPLLFKNATPNFKKNFIRILQSLVIE